MEKHQDHDDDENGAEAAYAVVSITIAIAPKAAAESPGEKDNHDDEKDQSERHGMVLWRGVLTMALLCLRRNAVTWSSVRIRGTLHIRRALQLVLSFRGFHALVPVVADWCSHPDHHHSLADHRPRVGPVFSAFRGIPL